MGELSELHEKLLRLKLEARTARAGAEHAGVRNTERGVLESKTLAAAAENLWSVLDAFHGKANFNPNQPRVPRGNPDGGQWTDGDGQGVPTLRSGRASSNRPSSNEKPRGIRVTIQPPPGIGHNGGPPLKDPSQLPPEPPSSRKTRLVIAKKAAVWLAKRVALGVPHIRAAMLIVEAARWLYGERHNLLSFADAPKTLKELQDAVGDPRRGYEIHHIVEQTLALRDGYPPSVVHGRDNLVRIPTWKHHLINGWYSKPNRQFGGLSPRDYLRGKDWSERRRVGRLVLIERGVLLP